MKKKLNNIYTKKAIKLQDRLFKIKQNVNIKRILLNFIYICILRMLQINCYNNITLLGNIEKKNKYDKIKIRRKKMGKKRIYFEAIRNGEWLGNIVIASQAVIRKIRLERAIPKIEVITR